jgi:hypothetical protein
MNARAGDNGAPLRIYALGLVPLHRAVLFHVTHDRFIDQSQTRLTTCTPPANLGTSFQSKDLDLVVWGRPGWNALVYLVASSELSEFGLYDGTKSDKSIASGSSLSPFMVGRVVIQRDRWFPGTIALEVSLKPRLDVPL